MKRILAGLLALVLAANGLVMLIAGAWWYGAVPGVTQTGPFNPHFVQDIGAAYIVAGVVMVLLALRGEAWRLATALFLHGGLLHVSLNMLALHQVGQVVERLYGRSGFLVIYVGAGLLGNLASLWWKQSGVSVGASGAIFGVYGALLAYLTAQRGSVPVQIFAEMRSGTLGFIGYSLFAGFAVPGIDNAAHVGGLLGGLLLGATLARPLVEPDPVRWQSPLAIGGLVVALVLGGVLWNRTPQVVQRFEMNTLFQQNAQQFSVEEQDLLRQQALLMDNLRHRRVTAVQALDTLDNDLIPRWDRQIGVLSDHLAAPEQDWQRVELIHYATARRDALKALAQAISTRQARKFRRLFRSQASTARHRTWPQVVDLQAPRRTIGSAARAGLSGPIRSRPSRAGLPTG